MNSGFKSQCVPEYRLLRETQIKRIHCATLELLETLDAMRSAAVEELEEISFET